MIMRHFLHLRSHYVCAHIAFHSRQQSGSEPFKQARNVHRMMYSGTSACQFPHIRAHRPHPPQLQHASPRSSVPFRHRQPRRTYTPSYARATPLRLASSRGYFSFSKLDAPDCCALTRHDAARHNPPPASPHPHRADVGPHQRVACGRNATQPAAPSH